MIPAILISVSCSGGGSSDSSSSDNADTVAQIAAVNSLNRVPNCGTVKGIEKKSQVSDFTLLANSATDVVNIDLGEDTSLTVRITPSNWDVLVERINPADCSVLDSINSLGTGKQEEIEISAKDGVKNAIRVKSADGSGS
ncbi:MAG: hypothetical protein K8R21_09130, partial [Leptospira sp.]|nr:hypothetical protein [Leptospira sp.]